MPHRASPRPCPTCEQPSFDVAGRRALVPERVDCFSRAAVAAKLGAAGESVWLGGQRHGGAAETFGPLAATKSGSLGCESLMVARRWRKAHVAMWADS